MCTSINKLLSIKTAVAIAIAFCATPSLAQYCTDNNVIRAANDLYVSAELGYGGSSAAMLRARANAIGPWELFRLCNYGSYYTLQSQANGLYVSAELGYGGNDYGMLRARANAIGPWEIFSASVINNINSGGNGLYVSAELGYGGSNTGMLRARANAIGPWEIFKLQ
jgi:hypothetical protein